MWQIILKDSARTSLLRYFGAYRDYFLDLFTDTGIWSEEIIRQGYIDSSLEMFREVMESIEKRCTQEHILASRKNGALYQVTCIYEHRYIDISYHEDVEKKIRTITDIRIWRKR